MVENGQRVCKLTFERMLEEPAALYGGEIGSSYQRQEETLGKQFALRRRGRAPVSVASPDPAHGRQLPLPLTSR
jgi:hypothetical protein